MLKLILMKRERENLRCKGIKKANEEHNFSKLKGILNISNALPVFVPPVDTVLEKTEMKKDKNFSAL